MTAEPSHIPASQPCRKTTVTSSIAYAVQLEHIGFSYDRGKTWTLHDLSLHIEQGSYVAIVGANGSGKSTLGRIIAGLSTPDYGTVTLCNQQVFQQQAFPKAYRQVRRHIGVVFQQPDDQLVATVVEDDVAFGPENLHVPSDQIRQRVDASLQQVGLSNRVHHNPLAMSGGQQQRVAIAGMLAMHAKMLILDEPCAMLDTQGRKEVLDVLHQLHDQGTTIVHITHGLEEALQADRIIAMHHGIPKELGKQEAIDFFTHPQPSQPYQPSQPQQTSYLRSIDHSATQSHAQSNQSNEQSNVLPTIWHSQAPADQPVLSAQHISFRFSGSATATLDAMNLEVMPGTITAIRGDNGSGKSTFARILSGIYTPQTGSISICGLPLVSERTTGTKQRSVKAKRKLREQIRTHIGYVMQHPEHQLFAETVAEDVAFGPTNQGLTPEHIQQRVHEALALVGIEHLAGSSPFALSGGQQRLVAIAGVLACHPDVVIWDEPTSSLDAAATARVHSIMQELKAHGIASIIITHDEAECSLADHVVTMRKLDAPAVQEQHHHRSLLQQLDPRATLVATLAMMFTTFAVNSPLALAITGLLCLAMMSATRTSPRWLIRSIHPFLALFAIMWVCNLWFTQDGTILWSWGALSITDMGLWLATLYFCRLVAVIAFGAMLIHATSTVALIDAMHSLMTPLSKLGFHTDELALVASLALRFVPTLGKEAQDIMNAQATRGGSIDTGASSKRLRAMAAIVVPVFAGALRHADQLALALDARCYEGGTGRTHLRQMVFTWKDAVYMLIALADIAAIVWLAFN